MNLFPSYEIWNWIPGYEGRYEISNRGKLRRWVIISGNMFADGTVKTLFRFLSTPILLKSHPNKWGYYGSHIGGKKFNNVRAIRIHREVAALYNTNPDNKPEVNHINGDKKCNEWWNFEWVTRMESIDHAFRTGLIKPALGEDQSNTKLKNEQVREIYNSKKKTKEISKEYNISTHTILDIKRGRTWWHITGHKRHIKPSEKGRFKKE